MKRIFTLLIVLTACINVANAQEKMMRVNLADNSYVDYYISEVDSVTFIDEPWELIGSGTYSFSGIFYSGSKPGTLYRNKYNPTQYKIDDWIIVGCPLYFECDEETGKAYIPEQNTGRETTASSVGVKDYLMVVEANEFTSWFSDFDEVDYNSYYDPTEDTFYFAIAYFMYTNDEHTRISFWGYSGYTKPNKTDELGYETFVIKDRDSAPIKKISTSVSSLDDIQITGDTELNIIKH